jgi:hypothetical protein
VEDVLALQADTLAVDNRLPIAGDLSPGRDVHCVRGFGKTFLNVFPPVVQRVHYNHAQSAGRIWRTHSAVTDRCGRSHLAFDLDHRAADPGVAEFLPLCVSELLCQTHRECREHDAGVGPVMDHYLKDVPARPVG